MSDASASNVKSSQSKAYKHVDVGQFAKRLSLLASNTAQSLYTVVHLHSSSKDFQVIENLAYKSYALAAALSSLADDLIQDAGNFKAQDVWSTKHDKDLLHSLVECETIFKDADGAVDWADKHFSASSGEEGADWIDRWALGCEHEKLMTVKKCYDLVMQTKMIARHTALTRGEHCAGVTPFEILRLARAFQNPVLSAIRTSPGQSQVSTELANTSTAPTTDSPTTQTESSTTSSPPKEGDPAPREPTPISAYNQWPPFNNPQHPAYLAAMANRPKNNSEEAVAEAMPPLLQPGNVTFGQPSIIKSPVYGSLFGKTVPTGGFANYSQSDASPFTPTAHLEGYVLRPTATSTLLNSTMLSYGIESLRLSEEAIQAQVRSWGAKRSIMEVLLDLHPQQLHLIQARAEQRQGHILCVEQGKPTTLSIPMGDLQVSSVMFVVLTTSMMPQNPFHPAMSVNARNFDPIPSFGQNLGGNGDVFKDAALLPPGFGWNTNTGKVVHSADYLSSPKAYSKHQQESGDPCTHVEKDHAGNKLQHYQTITTNKEWHSQDRSLEEIRLADYNANRTIPMKRLDVTYPWDKTTLFGFGNITPQPGPSVEVKTSPTTCFPAIFNPPAQSKISDHQEPKQGGLRSAFKPISNSSNPFHRVAPAMLPFVPPKAPSQSKDKPPRETSSGNAWDFRNCPTSAFASVPWNPPCCPDPASFSGSLGPEYGSLFGASASTVTPNVVGLSFGKAQPVKPRSSEIFGGLTDSNPPAALASNLFEAPSKSPSDPIGTAPTAPSPASCALFGMSATASEAAGYPQTSLFSENINDDSTPLVNPFDEPTTRPSIPSTAPPVAAKPASGFWNPNTAASAATPSPAKTTHRSSSSRRIRLQNHAEQPKDHEKLSKASLHDDAALDALLKSEKKTSLRAQKRSTSLTVGKSPHIADTAFDSILTSQATAVPDVDYVARPGNDHEDIFRAQLRKAQAQSARMEDSPGMEQKEG